MDSFDFAVVGAGIAGASVAYELAAGSRVVVLEGEDHPGYHATGRSAALYSQIYGSAAIRALTVASESFLRGPPPGFADHALVHPRGSLRFAAAAEAPALDSDFEAYRRLVPDLIRLTPSEALGHVAVLRPEAVAAAFYEPRALAVDVHALHHGYLAGARARGCAVRTEFRVEALQRSALGWTLTSAQGAVRAAIVINAGGAWADEVARLAGAHPLGVEPRRRTAITFETTLPAQLWPMVMDQGETFYMLPEGRGLLASPADETASPACDARPEEYDVALAAHLVETFTTLKVARIGASWAGLRSFSPDRDPVVGFDPAVEGFFWLAGQGGYGVQTAPALARTAAAWALHRSTPADVVDRGFMDGALSPARFGRATPAEPPGRASRA